MGELENHSAVVLFLALSSNILEESGIKAQDQIQHLSFRIFGFNGTGKHEWTQGGFKERKPGGSWLHQAVLQSAAGGWFANQQGLINKKGLAHRGFSQMGEKGAWLVPLHSLSHTALDKVAGSQRELVVEPSQLWWEREWHLPPCTLGDWRGFQGLSSVFPYWRKQQYL